MKTLVNKKSKIHVNTGMLSPEAFDFFSRAGKRGHKQMKDKDPEAYRKRQQHAARIGALLRAKNAKKKIHITKG